MLSPSRALGVRQMYLHDSDREVAAGVSFRQLRDALMTSRQAAPLGVNSGRGRRRGPSSAAVAAVQRRTCSGRAVAARVAERVVVAFDAPARRRIAVRRAGEDEAWTVSRRGGGRAGRSRRDRQAGGAGAGAGAAGHAARRNPAGRRDRGGAREPPSPGEGGDGRGGGRARGSGAGRDAAAAAACGIRSPDPAGRATANGAVSAAAPTAHA